jgi:RNA polymerase sigma factor (sigma-70 family)
MTATIPVFVKMEGTMREEVSFGSQGSNKRRDKFMTPHAETHTPSSRESFDEVVALIPALRAFARSFCKQPSDADDLVQETLTKAIAKIHLFKEGTQLKSWLFTIMRNTFYNRIVVMTREAPGKADCVASLPATPATQEWAVRNQELKAALRRLPAKQRDMLVHVTLEGASYIEAADRFGCDIGTVKSRLNRSRARLLVELGEQTAEGCFT